MWRDLTPAVRSLDADSVRTLPGMAYRGGPRAATMIQLWQARQASYLSYRLCDGCDAMDAEPKAPMREGPNWDDLKPVKHVLTWRE